MKLVQFLDPADGRHVGVVDGEDVVDLTQGGLGPRSVFDLYFRLGGQEEGLSAAAGKALDTSSAARRIPFRQFADGGASGGPQLLKPISGPPDNPHALRIWLAGVTHEVSVKLREIEAKQATGDSINVYDQKYRECAAGGRPELFSKNDPDAVVGSGQPVTRPPETIRLVPETELVSVYAPRRDGQIQRIGFTGGNDVTDNGIEANNPLDLCQAKNWSLGCASLGPVLVTADEFDDRVVPVSCDVLRDGKSIAYKEGETGQDRLNMPDGLFHLERMLFGRMALGAEMFQVLYWGTPIVFSEGDFPSGLQVGDVTRLTFGGGIGVLENPIVEMTLPDQLGILGRR